MLGMLEMISVWLILAVTLCGVAVNIDINLYAKNQYHTVLW